MAEVCDIFAHRIVNGVKTNEISTLHQSLLKLGKIADFFDRKRAKDALYLSRSKSFLEEHKDLKFDTNGEPILASLYEEAREYSTFDRVTNLHVLDFLKHEHDKLDLSYQEAYDKVVQFNKEYLGAHLFMATLKPNDSGSYNVEIVGVSEEEITNLINEISDMKTAEKILEHLGNLGAAAMDNKEVTSKFIKGGAARVIKGARGIILLNNEAPMEVQRQGLAEATGEFIVNILLNKDSLLLKRLFEHTKRHPEVILSMLGEDVYNDFMDGSLDIEKVVAKMLGFYLLHYESIKPEGILRGLLHLLRRTLDSCKKLFYKFTRNSLKVAKYEAKYAAFSIVKEFMGENFKGTYQVENVEHTIDYSAHKTFTSLRDLAKKFHVLINKLKGTMPSEVKDYDAHFSNLMNTLNDVTVKRIEQLQEGIGEEFITTQVVEETTKAYIRTLDFLCQKIEEALDKLLLAYTGVTSEGEPMELNQRAKIITYNIELFNQAKNLHKAISSFITDGAVAESRFAGALAEANKSLMHLLLGEIVTFQERTFESDEGGSYTMEISEETVGYEQAILKSRRALALQLLIKINDSPYLSMDKYVSFDTRRFRIRRHKATYINLENELQKTDINPPFQWISRYLDSMADSPDIINQMLKDCVEEEKFKANQRTLDMREKLRTLYTAGTNVIWYDKDGKRHKGINTEILFERYNNALDEFGEPIPITDDDGIEVDVKKGKSLTGNIISERNWGEWERERKFRMKIWEEDFWEDSIDYMINVETDENGRPIMNADGTYRGIPFHYRDTFTYNGKTYEWGDKELSEKERREYLKNFHLFLKSKAASAIETKRRYTTRSDMTLSASYLEAFKLAKGKWHKENSERIELTDKDGNKVLNSKGKVVKIWAPALSTSPGESSRRNKYDNPQFQIIKDTRNAELKLWYDTYISIKRELDELLPPGSTHPLGLRAPLFNHIIGKRLTQAVKSDNGIATLGMSIGRTVGYSIGKMSPNDVEFGTDCNTYDEDELYESNGALIYGRAHSNTLAYEQRLPTYGVKKLRRMEDLSTDLILSTLAYATMAYDYNCLEEVVDSISLTAAELKQRVVGKTELAIDLMRLNDSPGTYNRLEDYIKFQIFNDYSGSEHRHWITNVKKCVGELVGRSSMYFLGGNLHSTITNVVTGMTEIFKEATGGTQFERKHVWLAMLLYIMGWTESMVKQIYNWFGGLKGSIIEDHSMFKLFLRKYDVTNDNAREMRNQHIATRGWQVMNNYSLMQASMLPYAITDQWMQAIPFIATALATKLTKFDDKGNVIEKRSLWSLHKVKKETKRDPITGKNITSYKLVCADGNFEDWKVQDTNVARTKELMRLRINNGETLTYEEMLFLNDTNNEWVPWDEKRDNRYRLMCVGCNNRLHGVYNRGDGAAILGMIVGPLMLSLKKYAIGMFDRRFARTRYDYRLHKMRLGTTTTMFNLIMDIGFNIKDTDGNIVSGFEPDLEFLHFLDTAPVFRNLFGIINFLILYASSSIDVFRENTYRRKYLNRRGYSDELIRNIDRKMHDIWAILLLRMIITICLPPDDEEDKEWDKMEDDWPGAQTMLTIYSAVLKHFPFIDRMTVNDSEMLEKEGLSRATFKQAKVLPFSIRSIIYYQAYRALKEQYAYNALGTLNIWKGFKYGMWPEIRTLTESLLPSFAGAVDFGSLLWELAAITPYIENYMGDKITPEEYEEMRDNEDDKRKKYDNYRIGQLNEDFRNDYQDPYGVEVYQRGSNKDWYKYAVHLIRTIPYLRSLKIWRNGYEAAANMEFATKSEMLENADFDDIDFIHNFLHPDDIRE